MASPITGTYILSIQQMIDIANGGKLPGTGYTTNTGTVIPAIYPSGNGPAGDRSGTYSATIFGEADALDTLILFGFNESYITSAAGGKKEYYMKFGPPITL